MVLQPESAAARNLGPESHCVTAFNALNRAQCDDNVGCRERP